MHMHTCRYIFGLTSGVMCLDIHPENAFLVAVGLYDGKVAVYDFREVKNPVFQSDARTGKHTDPVWQVTGHDPCTWYTCVCTCIGIIVREEGACMDMCVSFRSIENNCLM